MQREYLHVFKLANNFLSRVRRWCLVHATDGHPDLSKQHCQDTYNDGQHEALAFVEMRSAGPERSGTRGACKEVLSAVFLGLHIERKAELATKLLAELASILLLESLVQSKDVRASAHAPGPLRSAGS